MSPNQSNTRDDFGASWYVKDVERDRRVLGPFGSASYAGKCLDRCSWPWPEALTITRDEG